MEISVLLFLINVISTFAYKPVLLLHGIMAGSPSMSILKKRIEELHPGTIVYNSDKYSGWASLENMWLQVDEIGKDLMNITEHHPEGVHLLGYSQGALIARSILQAFPNNSVHNFISLSGPQAGQFGSQFLHIIFPGLVLKEAFELFYSRVGQHTSVGNYWNDPNHQGLYYNYSQFLPYINNEVWSTRSLQFKESLTKLKKMVLIGGPDDEVITPWESSQFGYYDKNLTVLDLKCRDIYQNDLIGLKTLDDEGKLELITVPGITHYMWHRDNFIIDNYVVKYLD